MGACEDTNFDHECDYGCDKSFGTCEDTDLDHACDYGCDKVFGTCEDTNFDHACDYGCDKVFGTCEDTNFDHACDYGCDKVFGTCEDTNFDHECDYGCDAFLGACEDTNFDHECDHGCDKVFGEHADSDTDFDHECDYGCGAVIEECSDKDDDGDHNCDICGKVEVTSHNYSEATCAIPATCSECGATTGSTLEHVDADFNHICDNGCGKNDIGEHADSDTDSDHECDYGCRIILENCYDAEDDDDHDCDICGKVGVTSHEYEENELLATEATCIKAATKTYVCNCGDKITEDDGDALGHNVTGVEGEERKVDGCKYEMVYICQREDCKKEVTGEYVYHHDYVASISKAATCEEAGEKTFRCKDCGDTSKKAEVIPANATGHNWITGSVEDGIRTDSCSVCGTTKTVTVYVGNVTDEVNAGDLVDKEIELNDANISLDSGVIDTIGDQNVTVSADKLEGDDRKGLGLSTEELKQVGNSPIYNFTINNGTENISDFGEENYVTITLPYVLGEGEDVDSIAVWFINDEGKLESIKATYNNGYVTFKTNHFSYYTVTRLTPAQRCALYGHGYAVQHVEGNCTKDTYDLYVCVRCHDTYIDENSLIVADGHDYSSELHEAGCTTNGYWLYTCNDCGHSYRTNVNATGHSWSIVDSGEKSCTVDGFIKYGCDNCDEEYTVTYVKTGHSYVSEEVLATCSADGYTVYTCENCGYSYTDCYVEALGHDYEAGEWIWEANGNKAKLTFVCKRDELHVTAISVIASMEKVVEKGECSNYVIRTHTATVEFNGETYTDVMVIRQGNPTHKFSTEWITDKNEHWHECVCGVKTDIGEHSYDNETISKEPTCAKAGEKTLYCECGATKVVIIPATGEHVYEDGVCTKCGAQYVEAYYLNLANSWKNIEGFAIRIQDFSIEVKRKTSNIIEEFEIAGSIKQIDVAELVLYVEDGEICGALSGSLSVYSGPFSSDREIYDLKAVISDGYVYATASIKKGDNVQNYYLRASIDELIEAVIAEASDLEKIEYVLDFFTETINPLFATLIDAHADDINAVLEDAFNMLFTFEVQDDGSYVAYLDYDKLRTLNENLATLSIAEVLDYYFGEGAFDAIVDWALEILDLEISEIPSYLDEQGIDSADLIAKINQLIANLGAPEGTNIEDLLSSEEVAGVTIGMLIFETEDNSYVDFITEATDALRQVSLYALIAPDSVESIKMGVATIIDMVYTSLNVSFTTDNAGMLTAVNVDVDEFSYDDEYIQVDANCELDIIINGRIDVTWTDIIKEIESGIILPEADMLRGDSVNTYSVFDYVTYKGQEYEYEGICFNIGKRSYDKLIMITYSADCNDWMQYETMYPSYGYSFNLAIIEVDGTQVILLISSSGEIVELVQMETGIKAIYEDGTEKLIALDQLPEVEDETQLFANLYFIIFDNPKWAWFDTTFAHYYYNPVLKEFATQSQHELVYEYELLGETCNDGCIVRITCNNCDYYYEYTRYYCDEEYVEIDLSEYTSCGGYMRCYRCQICKKINFVEDITIFCNTDNQTKTEEVIGEDGIVHYVTTSVCSDCGMVFVYDEWNEQESVCAVYEYVAKYIYMGEECIFEYTYYDYCTYHEYEYTYELEGETCDDGVYVIRYCTKCGESDSYWRYGHHTEYVNIDLSEYSSCGGYIDCSRCVVCGEVDYIYALEINCEVSSSETPDEVIGEDGIVHYVTTSSCSLCGLVFVTEEWSVSEGSCYEVNYNTIYVYGNGELIFEGTEREYNSTHEYEYTYELEGETCDDGVHVSRYCTKCGESNSYWTYGHEYEYAEIDLSEYSSCGGYISYNTCVVCGETSNYQMNVGCYQGDYCEPQEITGEDGITHYVSTMTCPDCGLTFVRDEWTEQLTTCITRDYEGVYIYSGEIRLFEMVDYWQSTNHTYEYTYELLGTTCQDGVYVTRHCINCSNGESRYYTEGHTRRERVIDLGELGLCSGGRLVEYYCDACGTSLDRTISVRCQFRYEGENEDGYTVYRCNHCDATKLCISFDSEKDEYCTYTHTDLEIYLLNGEEIFRSENNRQRERHRETRSFVLFGTTCEEGYLITVTCVDCGNTYTDELYHHEEFTMFELLESDGYCINHDVRLGSCACGKYSYVQYYSNTFRYDEEQQLYVCDDCGLIISHTVEEVEDGCQIIETTTFDAYSGEELLYSNIKQRIFQNHQFDNVTVYENNGSINFTAYCQKCGTARSYETISVDMEEHGDGYYYDYYFTPETSATYNIFSLSNGDTYVTLYRVVLGELEQVAYNDDGGGNSQFELAIHLEAGVTYVYRISFYGQSSEGTINFVLEQNEISLTACIHNNSVPFNALLDGSESCEDGVINGEIYSECGCISRIYVEYEHKEVPKEDINLDEYGACYGTVKVYSCACGKEQSVSLYDTCCNIYNNNQYYDEQGRLIYVETRTCNNCSVRLTTTYYFVDDNATCTRTYYFTEVITVGANLISQIQYTTTQTHHETEITTTLLGGEESSCTDGVIVYYKCQYCDYDDTSTIYYHRDFEKEVIDLAELGSVCGGTAILNGCACGYSESISLGNSLCEFDRQWCDLWIEDAILESQYSIDGYVYYGYDAYVYVCAVTDPERCAYKIRYASYYLKEENSCIAYNYQTWQFGYNEETKTCEREITFKSSYSVMCHNYVEERDGDSVRYDCPDCGSYYYHLVHLDENNDRVVKEERLISNTLDNGYNKYKEEIIEYTYDAERGTNYQSRIYNRTVRADGTEYWCERNIVEAYYEGTFGDNGYSCVERYEDSDGNSYETGRAEVWYKGYGYTIYSYEIRGDYSERYDYTYSFDGCCLQVVVYTNSDGAYEESVNDYCRFYHEEYLLEPTCTQDGIRYRICVICDRRGEDHIISAQDHYWVQLGDCYYCSRCGMQNANGASGDIVMEDLTAQYGNGENYVVGYYARNSVEFTQYISLILADGTEVAIWEGIDIFVLDDVRAYAFNKEAVHAWATENGYTDYNVRISFVPVGSDGSFDYGVTFTDNEEIEVITDSISITDYVGEGEEKYFTISPTEDGIWTITSASNKDTYGYLYNADGEEIIKDDDGGAGNNFRIDYELKAGETSLVMVRWYDSSMSGFMGVIFNFTPTVNA